ERRTSVMRLALAFGLAATLAGLVLVSRSAGAGRAAVFPEGTSTGVVALDMSASIAGPIYARVATTLKGIVAANQSIGLVMFSDTAYRLLPANSPPGALLQFIRFFIPTGFSGGSPLFAESPWDNFSGGTRVADGLEMARKSLVLAHVKHGAILLVSDLDDAASDEPALYAEAQKLRNAHIPVRIVPLFADPANKRLFAALFGNGAFVKASVFTHTAKRHAQAVSGSEPWTLLTLGFVLVLLLAGNERWNGRFVAEVAS
ncbi:MAG TPA: vWA domain-containing protein, partial [Gaiellaceae bacterium]|nr:vWA domain-containing protein [Gaiellaceae bacterium]